MIVTYVPFSPHRPVAQYVGIAAPQGGMILPPEGYSALAESKMSGLPCQMVVIGEDQREDGHRFLRLGVTREWIEAVTNFRLRDGVLRWECPECQRLSGRHARHCEYER